MNTTKLLIIFISAFFIFFSDQAFSNEKLTSDQLDELLIKRIEHFRLKPFKGLNVEMDESIKAQARLGQVFYMDARMSGNKNMNCMICHHVMLGTSDRRPLSQTENRSDVLKRNSPSLFNIGFRTLNMFWDGRVSYDPKTKTFQTPEPAFNGENPEASHITNVMTSAASMQAIFPLVTHDEMMGMPGTNEIANAETNLKKWELIVKRFINPANKEYEELMFYFQKAFPGIKAEEINIGHFGESLNTFMKLQFESKDSPFHRFLNGDHNALSEKQKRGFEIFTGKGKCIACHQGNTLENQRLFASVGIPSYGAAPHSPDKGRGEVLGSKWDYTFKTPSLINIGLSAPYMHNGIFKSLREVVEHYSNIETTVRDFQVTPQMMVDYPVVIESSRGPVEIESLWNAVRANFLKKGLNFTEEEKSDLVEFLENGLTDPRFEPRRR